MSNFADLLGQLQRTAKRAQASFPTEGTELSSTQREDDMNMGKKKRRLDTIDTDAQGQGGCARSSRGGYPGDQRSHPRQPDDFHKLTISLSFLGIGAQKAGTTWLHEMLLQHPSLALPKEKEIHFWDWHRRKGLGWYSQQFPHQVGRDTNDVGRRRKAAQNDMVLYGEITPCYITLPARAIQEIKCLFPSVRIIFLARDLTERAWSALLMELRNAVRGVEVGKFPTDDDAPREGDKYDREADPDNYDDDYFMDRLRHSTHSERNDYAGGLRKWLEHFPLEQVLILNYNDVSNNPRQLLQRTLEHIGIEEGLDAFLDSLEHGDQTEGMKRKFNAAFGSTSNRTVRPSLRRKMESHLSSNVKEFNNLLMELGYDWKLGKS